MTTMDPKQKLSELTERQLEILRLFCEGWDYKSIADKLYLATGTVRVHIGNIYETLELDNYSVEKRRQLLFQFYCPALNDEEIQPTSSASEEPSPVSDRIMKIVEEDERAIIPMPPREIIDIKPVSVSRPRRSVWIVVGMILGSILTICIGVVGWRSYLWLNPLVESLAETPTQTTQVALEQTVEAVVSATFAMSSPNPSPASATQEVVIVTATPAPETKVPETQVLELTLPAQPKLLFKDDFDSGLSTYWQILSGSPIVVNGMLTAEGESWLVVGDPSWTDYLIEFDADAADCWFSWSHNTLAVRFTDLNNMIAWRWSDCESYWYVVENGNWNEVPQSEAKPGYEMLHFRVIVDGGQFTVHVDDQLLSSFFSQVHPQGLVGLRLAADTLIDNFTVKQASP